MPLCPDSCWAGLNTTNYITRLKCQHLRDCGATYSWSIHNFRHKTLCGFILFFTFIYMYNLRLQYRMKFSRLIHAWLLIEFAKSILNFDIICGLRNIGRTCRPTRVLPRGSKTQLQRVPGPILGVTKQRVPRKNKYWTVGPGVFWWKKSSWCCVCSGGKTQLVVAYIVVGRISRVLHI